MKRSIGIIGSGQVARTLGSGFAGLGYKVMMGSRDVAKLSDWKSKTGGGISTGSFQDAAAFGDIVILAVKGTAAAGIVESIAISLSNKTVLDTTNPIADAPPQNGVLRFFTDLNESLMEKLQKIAPDARFVKCFSCVGNAAMIGPKFREKPTMFICGNHEGSKKEVEALLNEVGWESADMGKAEGARAIEPLCILWCIPGFLRNEWDHAFKLLK